jgi:hypothetical protein
MDTFRGELVHALANAEMIYTRTDTAYALGRRDAMRFVVELLDECERNEAGDDQ